MIWGKNISKKVQNDNLGPLPADHEVRPREQMAVLARKTPQIDIFDQNDDLP